MRQLPKNPVFWPGKTHWNVVDSMASVQLSDAQHAQIKEIFDLFDTDGGGSIDCCEKDAAMYALGFQPLSSSNLSGSQSHQTGSQGNFCSGQGSFSSVFAAHTTQTITLPEFTTLMKGEHVLRNPVDAIWAAFAELSGSNFSDSDSGGVTLEGLKRAEI